MTRRAVHGKYFRLTGVLTDAGPVRFQSPLQQTLEFEDYQTFISYDEQKFYDWCLGILEDSGVRGLLKNDRLYLDSEFHADLHLADMVFELELSRTSVYFAHKDTGALRLLFPEAGTEVDGDVVESGHIRESFDAIRRQSVLNRLWAASTDLTSLPAATINNLRLDHGSSLVATEIETSLGMCTVSIRRGPGGAGSFRYTVLDASSAPLSPRVADAVMSDFSEDLGGCPEPETLLDVMIGTYELAQTDHEWLSI